MADRIATGEIRIDVNDKDAIASLRRIEQEFGGTMRDIDRKKAELDIQGNIEPLRRDLRKAQEEIRKTEGDSKKAARARADATKAQIAAENEKLRLLRLQNAQYKLTETEDRAFAKRLRDREAMLRKSEQAAIKRRTQVNTEIAQAKELARQYVVQQERIEKLNREKRKLSSGADKRARIDVDIRAASAKLELLRTQLETLGEDLPKIDVRVDNDKLSRLIASLTEVTVRVGPFTTTLAGLAKAGALLAPILVSLVGGIAALIGPLGAATGALVGLGAAAVTAGALLGGSLFAVTKPLIDEFTKLKSLSDAYRLQVLKTGADSAKAKKKLKEFNNALGEVDPATRAAFESLGTLSERWRNMTTDRARPVFLETMAAGIETVNHLMPLFAKHGLRAFNTVAQAGQRLAGNLQKQGRGGVLDQILGRSNRALPDLLKGLGQLGAALARMTASFARHFAPLAGTFADFGTRMNNAAKDTDRLDAGVDKLMNSLSSVAAFLRAGGRVIFQFFRGGLGESVGFVDGMTDGMNRLADSMSTVAGQRKISIFFADSIRTLRLLHGVLKPLGKLFLEYATIAQPFTNAILAVIRPVAELLQLLADFGPTRTILQGAFTVMIAATTINRLKDLVSIMASLKGRILGVAAAQRTANAASAASVLPAGVMGGPAGKAGKGGKFGGIAGKVGGLAKGAGAFAAVGAGMQAISEPGLNTGQRIREFGHTITGGILGFSSGAEEAAKQEKQINRVVTAMRKLADEGRRLPTRNVKDLANAFGDARLDGKDIDRVKNALVSYNTRLKQVQAASRIGIKLETNEQPTVQGLKVVEAAFDRMERATYSSIRQARTEVALNMKLIAKELGSRSQAGKAALSKNFQNAADAIKRSMDRGEISTERGTREIQRMMEKALALYGITGKQAKNIAKGTGSGGTFGDPDRNLGREGGGGAGGVERARGGLIQIGRKGQRERDNIPALLNGQPSIIANGEQVAVFNSQQQAEMDARLAPEGGLAGFFKRYNKPHYAARGALIDGVKAYAPGGIVALGRQLQGEGFSVTEHPAFGGVNFKHSPTGYHYKAGALDINADNFPGGEMKALDALAARLRAAGWHILWRVADHFDHLHVDVANGQRGGIGPGGPGAAGGPDPEKAIKRIMVDPKNGLVSTLAQAAVDTVRAGAISMLKKVAAESDMGEAGIDIDATGEGATLMRNISKQRGWNFAHWWELDRRESAHGTNLVNPTSTARLRGQFLDMNWGKYGPGSDPRQNPSMRQQIISMARYIAERYGNPSRALAHHNANNWYARGGTIDTGKISRRGGKVNKPTLLTGEEARDEFVIATNPSYRQTNIERLRTAAQALGVPMAAEGKTPKKYKPRYSHGAGSNVRSLKSVKEYESWKQKEENQNRRISIAEAGIKEPETLVRQVGTDAQGQPIFEADNAKISAYHSQLEHVMDLHTQLIDIIHKMIEAYNAVIVSINTYVRNRLNSIGTLENIQKANKRLMDQKLPPEGKTEASRNRRQKAQDRRDRAKERYDKAQGMIDNQRGKLREAREYRDVELEQERLEIGFRSQEYAQAREDIRENMRSLTGRAQAEVAERNPQVDADAAAGAGSDGLTYGAQAALADTERANVLREFGSNVRTGPLNMEAPAVSAGSSGPRNPALRDSFSVGQPPTGGGGGFQPGRGGTLGPGPDSGRVFFPSGSTAAAGILARNPRMGGGGEGGAAITNEKTVNITNNFAAPPPDSHTYVKGMEFTAKGAF